MKTVRLVIGIVSCVLFLLIMFQSCAAGLANSLEDNGSTSGSMGFFLAIFMLVAGIIGIAARKSKGGSITAGCFYLVGGLVGLTDVGIFKDLQVWAGLSIIFAVVFIISGIIQKKRTVNVQQGGDL